MRAQEGICEIKNLEQVYQLRLKTLAQSDFKISPQSLAIDHYDLKSTQLGYYHQGELISALRLVTVFTKNELEKFMDFRGVHEMEIKFPVYVIGKAGTLPQFMNQGHIKKLVEKAMAIAKERNGSVFLTIKPTNPGIPMLERMGFIKYSNPEGWHRFGYNSGGETLVMVAKN